MSVQSNTITETISQSASSSPGGIAFTVYSASNPAQLVTLGWNGSGYYNFFDANDKMELSDIGIIDTTHFANTLNSIGTGAYATFAGGL